MPVPDDRKIVLVQRESRLDELIARFNTVQQAQFYVEHLGADFGDYVAERERYRAASREVEATLRRFGRVQRLDRKYLANFIFGADDIVVALGQDNSSRTRSSISTGSMCWASTPTRDAGMARCCRLSRRTSPRSCRRRSRSSVRSSG